LKDGVPQNVHAVRRKFVEKFEEEEEFALFGPL